VVESRVKATRALELRKAGATLQAIADSPGLDGRPLYPGGPGSVSTAISKELERLPAPHVEEIRALAAEQLADLYYRTVQIMVASHPVRHAGKVVYEERKNRVTGAVELVAVEDDEIRLKAILVLLKVQESYRKMTGADIAQARPGDEKPDPVPMEQRAAAVMQRFRVIQGGGGRSDEQAAGEAIAEEA
jgi:hypothetical protein